MAGNYLGVGRGPASLLPYVALEFAASALGSPGIADGPQSPATGPNGMVSFHATVPPIVPVLKLIGPSTAVIPYGSVYIKCQGGMVFGCDQGVLATTSGGAAPGSDLASQVSKEKQIPRIRPHLGSDHT